jgi:hypothetical protein
MAVPFDGSATAHRRPPWAKQSTYLFKAPAPGGRTRGAGACWSADPVNGVRYILTDTPLGPCLGAVPRCRTPDRPYPHAFERADRPDQRFRTERRQSSGSTRPTGLAIQTRVPCYTGSTPQRFQVFCMKTAALITYFYEL